MHYDENEHSDEESGSADEGESSASSYRSCLDNESDDGIQPRISMSMNRDNNQPVQPPPLTTILSEVSQ